MTAGIVASVSLVEDAEALKSKGKNAPGRIGVNANGSATNV